MTSRLQSAALRRLGYYITSRVRCAARYARLVGCSISEAAKVFELNPGAVHNAWTRLYPMKQHPLAGRHARPTCSACGERGHLAVRGECSASELAVRMVASGTSVRFAARDAKLTTAAVYKAIEQRRRAA